MRCFYDNEIKFKRPTNLLFGAKMCMDVRRGTLSVNNLYLITYIHKCQSMSEL